MCKYVIEVAEYNETTLTSLTFDSLEAAAFALRMAHPHFEDEYGWYITEESEDGKGNTFLYDNRGEQWVTLDKWAEITDRRHDEELIAAKFRTYLAMEYLTKYAPFSVLHGLMKYHNQLNEWNSMNDTFEQFIHEEFWWGGDQAISNSQIICRLHGIAERQVSNPDCTHNHTGR